MTTWKTWRKKEWLSDYQRELLNNDSILNTEKLVPNQKDKKKYVALLSKPATLLTTGNENKENI